MQEDATVNETGATRMLSETIDVNGLKVFCHEGGAPWPGHFVTKVDYVAAL
jgi:hypothetical protein